MDTNETARNELPHIFPYIISFEGEKCKTALKASMRWCSQREKRKVFYIFHRLRHERFSLDVVCVKAIDPGTYIYIRI